MVSTVGVGSGTVRGEHGLLPVPAPAVVELLSAAGAPVSGAGPAMELCTPIAAALLTVLEALMHAGRTTRGRGSRLDLEAPMSRPVKSEAMTTACATYEGLIALSSSEPQPYRRPADP
jgi:uncharacterized protein (DUF111 family)